MEERNDLQNTLKTLTEEVEFLSNANQKFLKELQMKEFYEAYKQQNEELTKLREAHAIVIDLIRAKEVKVAGSEIKKAKSLYHQENQMKNANRRSKGRLQEMSIGNIFSCKENAAGQGRNMKEAHETMK